jgi:serine/threonine protein kinase
LGLEEAAGLIRADQRRRWRAGHRVPLEMYLAARPDLAADPSVLLDLVYNEYLLAEELGPAPAAAGYAARFPAVAGELAEQLDLHRALDATHPAAPADPNATRTAEPGGPPARDPSPPDPPGYEVLGELGRGGMGVVYKARQPRLNRVVALKSLPDPDRTDAADAIRFLAEAEAVAAVHHPHVVQVYELGQHAGRPYFAMEFCPGGSLRDRLDRAGPVPPAGAAALVAKIARGVHAAHEQQIVHRDLKPANVLFDAAGEPKVVDFGLARRGAGAGLTRTQTVMGTPAYMAPEQARGDAKFVGPAADVYALGVILYECLTAAVPFPGDNALAVLRRVAEDVPESPRRRNPAVHRDLELVCLKCLRKDPADR